MATAEVEADTAIKTKRRETMDTVEEARVVTVVEAAVDEAKEATTTTTMVEEVVATTTEV